MKYTKADKRRHLMLECRFFNDETENPFKKELEANDTEESKVKLLESAVKAWEYERWWVDNIQTTNLESLVEEYNRHGCDGFEEDDGTPVTLKAVLWNRFYQDMERTETDSDSYKKWYLDDYHSRQTFRQVRADERRKTLIPKCRFYKGGDMCTTESLTHNMFWEYERLWVEALSYSFQNGEQWRQVFHDEHLWLLARKHEIPASLIGLLCERYKHHGHGGETTRDFMLWLEEFYIKPTEKPAIKFTMQKKQEIADKRAQLEGYEFAVYLGEDEQKSVFKADSNEERTTGLPMFITIDDQGVVNADIGFMYMNMVRDE